MSRYSQEFIALQLQFAQRLAVLMDAALGPVLAEHTVLRHLLDVSINREDQSDPLWQEFVRGLSVRQAAQAAKLPAWAYDFYQAHLAPDYDLEQPRFGCFYAVYPFRGTRAVRLHFENISGASVLGRASVAVRQSELKQLFTYIYKQHPDAERVRGGSWLYHIEAYRRLFPPEYVATAVPVGYETGFFALWGQFLRADGTVRQAMAAAFLGCLERQSTLEGCLQCFPYEVLRPECSIDVFYEFYGVNVSAS